MPAVLLLSTKHHLNWCYLCHDFGEGCTTAILSLRNLVVVVLYDWVDHWTVVILSLRNLVIVVLYDWVDHWTVVILSLSDSVVCVSQDVRLILVLGPLDRRAFNKVPRCCCASYLSSNTRVLLGSGNPTSIQRYTISSCPEAKEHK